MTTSTVPGPPSAWLGRRWWIAVAILVVALGVAALLSRASYSNHDIHSQLVGHAKADVTRTITDRDGLLLGLGIAIAALGTGVAVGLVAPTQRPRHKVIAGVATTILVAGLATGIAVVTDPAEAAASRGVLSHTRFASTAEFTAAMEAADLACTSTRRAPIDDLTADAIVCSLPWTADIRDRHDDLFVAVWPEGGGSGWLLENVDPSTPAVAGESWIATCEFRSTCALIGDRLHEVDG